MGDANIYPRLHLYQEEISSWWLLKTYVGTKGGPRTGNPNNRGELWQCWEPTGACCEMKSNWLLNGGSALGRLKNLFALEVLIAHLCLYIQEVDYIHQGDWNWAYFLSQHRSVRRLTPGAHTERTSFKWTEKDPICWFCWGPESQPETSGNFWVLQDCKVISITLTGLSKATLFHTRSSARSESSLSPPLFTHVLQTCKIFSEIRI